MPLRTHDVRRLLEHKFDFSPAEGHEQGHVWFKLKLEGPPEMPVITTRVSHGRKDIPKGIEKAMAEQLGVPKKFLIEMMQCTKSREEYYQYLRDNPITPRHLRR